MFEGATFQVNYGERVALVGPNGAGKTTLFSLILKQREPDEGVVQRDEWTLVGAAIIIASGLYTAHRERIRARGVRPQARAVLVETAGRRM